MKVTGLQVLIKPLTGKEKSGLIVPDMVKKPHIWGEIVDAGSECEQAKAGGKCIYPPRKASIINTDEGVRHFMHESQIHYFE